MFTILMLLLGLCLGSFFNVIVSRADWRKGHSRCDNCNQKLKWYDLVPIVSFLLLKGKCRYCNSKINRNHLISEFLLGLGFAIVSTTCLPVTEKIISYVAVLALGYNAISDMHERLTYTWVIYVSIVIIGILKLFGYHYTLQGVFINVTAYIMFAVMCFLLSIIASRYVGAGDLDVIFLLFLCSRIYSLILFFSLVITTISMMFRNKKVKEHEKVAFVPYLYIGYLISVIAGGI